MLDRMAQVAEQLAGQPDLMQSLLFFLVILQTSSFLDRLV